MKTLLLAAGCSLLVSGALLVRGASAAETTCKDNAADKKLAGAAMSSFMQKCMNDAATACNATAEGKKLGGAAKTSFTKKCMADAVGR